LANAEEEQRKREEQRAKEASKIERQKTILETREHRLCEATDPLHNPTENHREIKLFS
jgi:hypothetical protein